jgi:gas vesicle protein
LVGLLAAPKSGEELRKTVRKSVDDARQLATNTRQRVDEVRRALPDRLAELPQRASEQFARWPEVFKRQREHSPDASGGGTHVTVDAEHSGDAPPSP